MNRLFMDFNGMVLVVGIVLFSPLICTSQITEDEAVRIAKSDRCVTVATSNTPQFSRSIRREDLEDQLFSIRTRSLVPPVKPAYIFEVSSTGTYITEKNEVIAIVSNGANNKLIAVSKFGEIFPLFGCDEKRTAFLNLMMHSKVSIQSEDDARAFGLLYYKLVEDPELKRIIFNRWEIRHQAEDFFLRQHEKDGEAKYRRWETNLLKARIPDHLGIVSAPSEQRFAVTIYFMEFQFQKPPRLKQEVLDVEPTGKFKINKTSYLL